MDNLVKSWPQIGRLVYERVTFSCKVGICMGPISNSQRHVPTKTKLELSPGLVHHELSRVDPRSRPSFSVIT